MSRTPIPHHLRHALVVQFQSQCCYCRSQQLVSGVSLTVDHIIPETKGGETILDNLCLACWDCNMAKGKRTHGFDFQTQTIAPLFHPQHQRWNDHFCWSDDGLLAVGTTAIGRVTIHVVKMNRIELIKVRALWVLTGWHPPD